MVWSTEPLGLRASRVPHVPMSPCPRVPSARLFRAAHHRPTLGVLSEHLMHHGIHRGADADRLHYLDAQALHQIARDDDLADEAHAQTTVLGLDDHDPLALDQLALHERLPEDDDPVHQPLTIRLALRQRQVLLHQETLRVARLGIPPGHLGLVLTHVVFSIVHSLRISSKIFSITGTTTLLPNCL